MTKEIALTKGYAAIVDDDDFDRLSAYKWTADARPCGKVYARRNSFGKKVYLHREIMGHPPSTVDHVSGDALDNRKENLRTASNKENVRNARKRSDSTNDYKGIQRNRGNWSAFIVVDGSRKYLGTFKTQHEAASAYDRAAMCEFGSFARTNFKSEVA